MLQIAVSSLVVQGQTYYLFHSVNILEAHLHERKKKGMEEIRFEQSYSKKTNKKIN